MAQCGLPEAWVGAQAGGAGAHRQSIRPARERLLPSSRYLLAIILIQRRHEQPKLSIRRLADAILGCVQDRVGAAYGPVWSARALGWCTGWRRNCWRRAGRLPRSCWHRSPHRPPSPLPITASPSWQRCSFHRYKPQLSLGNQDQYMPVTLACLTSLVDSIWSLRWA